MPTFRKLRNAPRSKYCKPKNNKGMSIFEMPRTLRSSPGSLTAGWGIHAHKRGKQSILFISENQAHIIKKYLIEQNAKLNMTCVRDKQIRKLYSK